MDAKTQAEYDRIKAGPHKGGFTLLHHEGPICEQSDDVMKRVDYILKEKPLSEHYDRLRHIRPISKSLYDDCEAKWKSLYDDYMAKWKSLYDDYEAKWKPMDDEICQIIPNCSWDGKTIFGKS